MTRRAEFTLKEAAEAQPFTPETLADRWQCSASHIRKMIGRGELRHFRVGGMLLRIPARVVEEVEQCQTTDLDAIEDNGPSSPEPDPEESVVRLEKIEGQLNGSSIG